MSAKLPLWRAKVFPTRKKLSPRRNNLPLIRVNFFLWRKKPSPADGIGVF
jgi:hypothetical protein